MYRIEGIQHINSQKGAVLIFALIIFAITSMISTTALQTGVLEVKMVSNSQFNEEAFQKAEALVNAITVNHDDLAVTGEVGYTICGINNRSVSCNASLIDLPATITAVPTGANLSYQATRLGPLFAPLPFRLFEGEASSSGSFNVALFEINAEYDGRENRLGHYNINQGIAIKIAVSGQ